MNNAQETKLREGMNIIKVRGILAEKNLGFYDKDTFVTKDTQPLATPPVDGGKIAGTVSIKVDDERTIEFAVDIKATTKAGGVNPAYEGMVTVMREYKSIAEVGIDNATRVAINRGQFNIRGSKRDPQSDIKTYTSYKATYFNRIDPTEELNPCATYDLEVIINGFQEEYDKEGNETGNVVVKCWLPIYGGKVEPIELLAEAENGVAAAVQKYYEPGDTVNIQGLINNRCIIDRQEIPMKIGAPKILEKRTYINALTITGVSEAYNKVPDLADKAFDRDMVMVAIQERTAAIEERARKKAEGETNTNANAQMGSSMFGMNFGAKPSVGAPKRTLPTGW